jgi:ABC-type ATPase involved in cell division
MIELVDVRLDHPRGGAALVSDGNLKVTRGEVVLIVGAAGVGTSRLVSAVLGDTAADAGRIELFGRDVAKLRRSSLRLMRRRIGIVPQDLCLLEDRSARDNVMLPLEIDGYPRSASLVRADAALVRVGMLSEATLRVANLPSSARQRVALARALVREPELLIADQPTSLQDSAGCELVATSLAEVALTGASVLVLGRDPMLRELAHHHGWRQLGLIDGRLRPVGEIELTGHSMEELLVAMESARVRPVADTPSNLVPFPVTAGVAS